MKKTREKFLAVLLTFAMLFGSSLTVIAEEIECKDLNVNDVLTEGDSIILSQEVNNDRLLFVNLPAPDFFFFEQIKRRYRIN